MKEYREKIYKGIEARTFKTGVIQLLEQEYKILGSHKVISLIAEDIEQLHRHFYPEASSKEPGVIQWVTTSVENKKSQLGKEVEKTVTVDLPYFTREDIQLQKEGITKKEHDLIRLGRLTKVAFSQGGLLTQGELAVILNLSIGTVSRKIREYQKKNKEMLPIKGYFFDLGRGTTHKGIIIELYEEGFSPPDIAKRVYHSLEAVDRYIKDYERVKFLLRQGLNKTEICKAIGKGKNLVGEYIEITLKFYPTLGKT
jgi:DNA-binding CsgD family transcriptional regulator